MPNLVKLKEILQTYWKHSSFRPLQEEIITSVLHQKDTLAILPTGGGKSLCYQIPALYLEGTCVVISPLLALIQDQIHQLKQKGIAAATIPSNSTVEDIVRIFDNINVQKCKLLYVSPERLLQPIVLEKLASIPLSFIAVDEAHCISHWGHDFRPSYLKIGILKKQFPNLTMLAVTATATPKTQTQISNLLHLQSPNIFIGSFTRKNLAYQVFETPQKFDLLTKILQKRKVVTIIYLQNKLAVQEINHRLNTNGFKSTYYHASLTPAEKEKNALTWLQETTPIMVATNAFGMGINKSNVRLVIHLEIPSTLENYLQEAGRAGRDEQKSFSCVILSENDYTKFQQQIHHTITFKDVATVYQKLQQHFQIAYGDFEEKEWDFNLDAFCQKYQLNTNNTVKALRRLDNYQILHYQEKNKTNTLLKVICTHSQLLQFCQQHTSYKELIDTILRNYTGIFEIPKKLNLARLISKTGLSLEIILKKLRYLAQIEYIDFKEQQNLQSITFLLPREDKKTLNPIEKDLTALHAIEQFKHKSTIAYFKNNKVCRNKIIVNYFQQPTTKECGICDICIQKKQNVSLQNHEKKILLLLSTKPHTFNELLISLQTNSLTLKHCLTYLLNENKIKQQQPFYLLQCTN